MKGGWYEEIGEVTALKLLIFDLVCNHDEELHRLTTPIIRHQSRLAIKRERGNSRKRKENHTAGAVKPSVLN